MAKPKTKVSAEVTAHCEACGQLIAKPKATKASRSVPVVARGGPVDPNGPRPASWLGVWPPLTLAQLAASIPASFDDEDEQEAAVS